MCECAVMCKCDFRFVLVGFVCLSIGIVCARLSTMFIAFVYVRLCVCVFVSFNLVYLNQNNRQHFNASKCFNNADNVSLRCYKLNDSYENDCNDQKWVAKCMRRTSIIRLT